MDILLLFHVGVPLGPVKLGSGMQILPLLHVGAPPWACYAELWNAEPVFCRASPQMAQKASDGFI